MVVFYGISTLVGYLMANPVFIYIYMICNAEFLTSQSSFVCTQLNAFKYSEWLNSSICLIGGTLTSTTTLGQSEPGSNSNEGVFHILQSSRTGAST